MYQKFPPNPYTSLEVDAVKRIADSAFIPFDPINSDYQEYLKWISEGNEPLPADEPNVGTEE